MKSISDEAKARQIARGFFFVHRRDPDEWLRPVAACRGQMTDSMDAHALGMRGVIVAPAIDHTGDTNLTDEPVGEKLLSPAPAPQT